MAPHKIILEFTRASEADKPYAFEFAPQTYILHKQGGGAEQAKFPWSEELLAVLADVRLPGRAAEVPHSLGETLREFLAGTGWNLHEAGIHAARRARAPIFVSIRSNAGELYALPWELVALRPGGQLLGGVPDLLVRYEWPGTETFPDVVAPRKRCGRVLFAYSGQVPAAQHLKALRAALGDAFDPERDVVKNASIDAIHRALEAAKRGPPIDALHILCHGAAAGATYGLVLHDRAADDGPVVIDAGRMQQLLDPHAGMVRMVVLAACDSGNAGKLGNHLGSVAQRIHCAGVQAVVGSRFPISAQGSVSFTESFYKSLVRDRASLEEAFVEARKNLVFEHPRELDWASLQLFARSADGDSTYPIRLPKVGPHHARLAGLLGDLFDPDALRRFFRHRPPLDRLLAGVSHADTSREDVIDEATEQLFDRGLVNADLFAALIQERPGRVRDIEAAAREVGIELAAAAPTSEASPVDSYRRSIGLLRVDDVHGCTAWLVGPDRAVTTREAVARLPAGLPLVFEIDGAAALVRSVGTAPDSDCAVIELQTPLPGRRPLPIAGRCAGRAPAWTIGYSRARRGWSVPLDELLVFPIHRGDSVTVHSETLSVHMESHHHCLAGAPIIVEDHVVAMVSQRIEREDEPGRSLSALVQTCAARQILARLGRAADRPEVGSDVTTIAPTIAADQFHTFVAFSGANSEWARSLEQRLTLEGFRAFLAEPGRARTTAAGPLREMARRSRSAIVLYSRSWDASLACNLVGTMLLQRREDDPEFRLVVIRLDDVPLKEPWSLCHIQDFRGARGPYGPRWDDLVHALVWRAAPSPTTPGGAQGNAETSATDTMEADLWAAAQVGASEVMSVWRGWKAAGALSLAPSLRAAEYLISQSREDLALEVLQHTEASTRREQLRALALSRTGKDKESLQILERLHRGGILDAETMGLLAGRYKRLWAADGRRLWLERAQALYSEAFERFGESYTGINAAALALYLGKPELSARIARDVLAVLEAVPERSLDHWKLATFAEVWHLLGDVKKASARYAEAVRLCPEFYSDIATMRTQARRNARHLGHPEDVFDEVLTLPRVVAFVGHMEDARDRAVPRLPPALIAPVREAIRVRLRDLSAGFGYSSLARGADILFVEEMLARRSQIRAFLPFPAPDFEQTSVGPRWTPRFRELLAEPRIEVQVLADRRPPEDELATAFYACSHAMFQRAIEFAQGLGEKPVLLAVWDGQPGDGRGGTADAIAYWQLEGHELSVIDIAEMRRARGL